MKGLFGFGKKKEAPPPAQSAQESKYVVEYDRRVCIGSGTCAAVCEKHWVMNKDGKAELVGSVFNESKGVFEKAIPEGEFACNKMAAEGCPPNCIRIFSRETGEKVA